MAGKAPGLETRQYFLKRRYYLQYQSNIFIKMSMFHYVTFKYVVIKDKRLGVAYYILAAVILAYTFTQIVWNKAYLQFDHSPSGNFRIITNSPPLKSHEAHLRLHNGYCCDPESAVDRLNCQQCRTLDGLALNWPVESKAVTIATFIKERWEETGHNSNDSEEYTVIREDSFFTLNPEHVLLKIEHSISALESSEDPLAVSHRKMNGWLVSAKGRVVKQLNSDGVHKPDKIRLTEFLQAAEIHSLDEKSDALNSRQRSFRENGAVLRVMIQYTNSNRRLFGTNIPEYRYIVRRIPYSDYKVKQEIPVIEESRFLSIENMSKTQRRVVRKRFCIRVEFLQCGKIGQFSLFSLIIHLISGFGLLSITGTVLDTWALYVLPAKEIYSKYVYEYSPELNENIKND